MPWGLLFLPCEMGGHGHINLVSRTAAFRLQFMPTVPDWSNRPCLEGCGQLPFQRRESTGAGERSVLNWFDFELIFQSLETFKLPQRRFWLLKEPLIYGARLDISCKAFPGVKAAPLRAKTVDLQCLLRSAGLALSDHLAIAHALGVDFDRLAEKLLQLWKDRLSPREKKKDSCCSSNQEQSQNPLNFSPQHISALELRERAHYWKKHP